MKKRFYILIMILGVFIITGCGKSQSIFDKLEEKFESQVKKIEEKSEELEENMEKKYEEEVAEQKQKQFTNELTRITKNFYENFYYKNIGTDDTSRIDAIKRFSEMGLKVNLENIITYTGNTILENECDKEKTSAVIYPKDPYGKADYTIKVNLHCGNINFEEADLEKEDNNYLKFGSSKLYYGTYKVEGDLPSGFSATLTIKKDGTAEYKGDKLDKAGNTVKVNLTGEWNTYGTSKLGDDDSSEPSSDRISFNWSDNSSDTYKVGDKYLGDQFMGFKWISE